MPPPEDGWERWRGEVDQRLDQDAERIVVLEKWKGFHEEFARKAMLEIVNRINQVERDLGGRIMWMCGVGAGLGSVAGALIAWFLGKP